MSSPSVPKLNLAPMRFNRLDSVEENKSSHDRSVVQSERIGKDVNPRGKRKKKKKLIKRLSRRDSMMELLREDLKNIDPLPVLKTFRPPSENDILKPDDEADGDISPFHKMAALTKDELSKRRKSCATGTFFRGRRMSSNSSDDTNDVVVSGYELKKIRMIESLQSMGFEIPKARERKFSSDEKDILERMSLTRKNSLSTRLLQAIPDKRRRNRSRSLERNKQKTPVLETELSEDSKEKLQKMLNIMNQPVSNIDKDAFSGKLGTGTLSNNDYAFETLGTFRRKIRRRKSTIATEAKRILQKPPGTRTDEELHYVKIALRNYKSIVEYPVEMQHKIASRGWYESYDTKRVIIREGHIPVCFYFVLTGSAVVSYLDGSTSTQKTVLFLHRGDSFGEQAIMTQSLRQTTVISREKIELLVMYDEDFIDIFMSGGLRDLNDPFILSLSFLKGWPLEKLAENPKKAIFSFFKRNTVLSKDSTKSDWIFVVKSGSCSVFKKLRSVDPKRKVREIAKKEWRKHIEDSIKVGASLSHEDQLTLLCEEQIKRMEQQNLSIRYYALPEINIATNAAYDDLRKQHNDMIQASQVKRAMEELKTKAADAGSVVTDPTGEEEEQKLQEQAKSYRRMSIVDLSNLVAKVCCHINFERSYSISGKDSVTTYPTIDETYETLDDYATGYDVTQERASSNGPPSTKQVDDFMDKQNDSNNLYVIVNILTKGQVFGLEDVVFDNQPGFSLVSNGAEVIMINKKFYTENLTTHQYVVLRESVWPYPSDEKLQRDLETKIRWDYQKRVNLKNVLRNNKITKMNVHDARSSLEIPPPPEDDRY
ncbi:hypothetical protein FSP39_017507 [Pinctada imbricata]|uniref:Cyclic nucleotide-binding domain-containing protein n=1 Tax=Pinctada imbricata TaxID=66713 RepID=A0AA89CB31_PINIB|nr:hypothetical protein FSP39_017507 [Pinctada imbricata]